MYSYIILIIQHRLILPIDRILRNIVTLSYASTKSYLSVVAQLLVCHIVVVNHSQR